MTHAENGLIFQISKKNRPRRLSVLAIAKNVLNQNLRIESGGRYLLWQLGRWCQVNLDDVMRAANTKLKGEGRPQITLNPAWVAK